MKLVTFEGADGPRLGALVVGAVLDLCAAAGIAGVADFPTTMQALIESGEAGLHAARGLVDAAPPAAIVGNPKLLAPIPVPVRLRDTCMFLEHMEVGMARLQRTLDAGSFVPTEEQVLEKVKLHKVFYEQVIYYNADHMHVVGNDDDIHWPNDPTWADYELEIGCVIGRTARDIDQAEARDHIFGLTIFNDWSARDLQIPFMQANLGPGHGKDFANSLGPCIVTIDEFDDLYDLTMTARVNGEEWSRGSSRSMSHPFEKAIAEFSSGKTVHAGEIFGSGTVVGGCGFELNRKLAHGDIVELEIEGIGVLRNRVLFPGR